MIFGNRDEVRLKFDSFPDKETVKFINKKIFKISQKHFKWTI